MMMNQIELKLRTNCTYEVNLSFLSVLGGNGTLPIQSSYIIQKSQWARIIIRLNFSAPKICLCSGQRSKTTNLLWNFGGAKIKGFFYSNRQELFVKYLLICIGGINYYFFLFPSNLTLSCVLSYIKKISLTSLGRRFSTFSTSRVRVASPPIVRSVVVLCIQRLTQ